MREISSNLHASVTPKHTPKKRSGNAAARWRSVFRALQERSVDIRRASLRTRNRRRQERCRNQITAEHLSGGIIQVCASSKASVQRQRQRKARQIHPGGVDTSEECGDARVFRSICRCVRRDAHRLPHQSAEKRNARYISLAPGIRRLGARDSGAKAVFIPEDGAVDGLSRSLTPRDSCLVSLVYIAAR